MKKESRADKYIAERDKGLTYREIAEKFGVSYQAVAMAISKRSPGHFKPYTKKDVVYPNLRRWLNKNKICRNEFIRRMGWALSGRNSARVSSYFHGENYPTKQVIDKMLEVTGLTYEKLFAKDESEQHEE